MPDSAILYKNADNTVFLIDIPTSIALAQHLSSIQAGPALITPAENAPEESRKYQTTNLLSSAPINKPYSLSSEPKTDVARARLLERFSPTERVYHADIVEPLVCNALNDIRTNDPEIQGTWCFPRRVIGNPNPTDDVNPGKRKQDYVDGSSALPGDFPLILDEESSAPSTASPSDDPPLILAPGANIFASPSDVYNSSTRNTSSAPATLQIAHAPSDPNAAKLSDNVAFYIPPLSSFVLCRIPMSPDMFAVARGAPIPGLPASRKFDLILLDPPWHNKSVRRSRHYRTQSYRGGDSLMQCVAGILRAHLQPTPRAIAAIWITNSGKARAVAYGALRDAGLHVCEEWVWAKTTVDGEPISALGGLWRKPYEILVIGRRGCGQGSHPHSGGAEDGPVTRRVIAAVPDVHSRKPNLREVLETVFFGPPSQGDVAGYSALEVFARNLTAGWWACGDEVLKFNQDTWWVQ
ncbi:MT-A70-domain-containing protein [Aspergillus floccosus]